MNFYKSPRICFASQIGKWKVNGESVKKKKGKWKPLLPNCTYLETGENVTDHEP